MFGYEQTVDLSASSSFELVLTLLLHAVVLKEVEEACLVRQTCLAVQGHQANSHLGPPT